MEPRAEQPPVGMEFFGLSPSNLELQLLLSLQVWKLCSPSRASTSSSSPHPRDQDTAEQGLIGTGLWSLVLSEAVQVASLVVQLVKNPPAMRKTWAKSLGWEDPLEEGMSTHSSVLAWRIPWTEEPGGLQSMGSQRVRHDRATKHNSLHKGRAVC